MVADNPVIRSLDIDLDRDIKLLEMAIFSENDYSGFDYETLRESGISLYRRDDYLEEDVEWLRQVGYHLYKIDCKEWQSEREMNDSLSRELSFPSYYAKNLDTLNDVITEVYVPAAGGVALVLLNYDQFAKGVGITHSVAEAVLKILSRASHQSLLTGKRFITLVHSNDPELSFPKLGVSAPSWNRREWLNKDRGL